MEEKRKREELIRQRRAEREKQERERLESLYGDQTTLAVANESEFAEAEVEEI